MQQEVINFFKEHARNISIGALIVVVLGGGFFLNRRYQSAHRLNAAENLRKGVALFYSSRQSENPDYGFATASLKDVLERYAGTAAASQAALYLGHIYYIQGDYNSSLDYYKKAASKVRPDSPFLEIALFDVAYAMEAKGDYKSAKDAYQSITDLNVGVMKDRAVMGIGRCYELQGDSSAAIETYTSMLQRFPNSPWANELRQRLNLLKSAKSKAS